MKYREVGTDGTEGDERVRLLLVTGVILLALGSAVVLLRLQRLAELPPRLDFDEGAHGVDALLVLQGEHAVFFSENHGREGLIVYAIALCISFLGRTMLAVRLPTALASAGAVFVVFWLGQILFGRDEESGQATPWRGLLVGGVGASLIAVSLGQTMIGRMALRGNFLPLLLTLCLALLWEGHRSRSWWRIALAGACAGLLPYTYIAARFTLLLFLIFGLSFLLPRRSDNGATRRIELLKRNLPWTGLFLGVAVLVAAPIFIHFSLHPEEFFARSSEVLIFRSDRSQGGPLGAFLVNVWEHLLLFVFRGDPNWDRNFPGRPMLNFWEAFFFWLGTAMAIWRGGPAYRLLLIWLGVMILPAVLAGDIGSTHTLRMIGAIPAIYLLIGVGMWEAYRFLKERSCALPWRTNRFVLENRTKGAIAVGVAVSGLILVQGVDTYRTYFHQWAAQPVVYDTYEGWLKDLARSLNPIPADADTVYLIPGFSWSPPISRHYSFKYLNQGTASVHAVSISAPDLAQKVRSILSAKEDISTVKVVEWNTANRWKMDDIKPLDFLLRKYGRYQGSDDYTDLRIHNYVDFVLERPWEFYEQMEPLTVLYDGGIALQGIALGQKEVQLSSKQLLDLGRGGSLWGVLRWQTTPGLDIDYAMSLRLYNTEGEMVYQADDLLWKSTSHTPTSHWSADETADTLVQLDFPDDLPPSEYELRLVVYNFDTQVPTVEIGVWKPEVTLARLLLAEVK